VAKPTESLLPSITDPEKVCSGCQAHDTLWHRRAEDGKVEYLLVTPSTTQSGDQVKEIRELLKEWKEEIRKMGQASTDSQTKKRAASLVGFRRSSRLKKPRQ